MPIGRFRRRSKASGERHPRCNDCRNKQARATRAAKGAKSVLRYSREINREECDRNCVIGLTAQLAQEFGGVQRFAAHWHAAYLTAKVLNKHNLVTSYLNAALKLMTVTSQLKSEHPPSDLLSDEDLEREHKRKLVALIHEHPDLALWAVSQIPGWKIARVDGRGEPYDADGRQDQE